MWEASYIGPDGGEAFELLGTGMPRVQIDEGGISDLVPQVEDATIESVGVPGQTLTHVRVLPLEATLTGRIVAKTEKEADALYRKWRRSWVIGKHGTILMKTGLFPALSMRLRPKSVTKLPARDPLNDVEVPFAIDVVADRGPWAGPVRSGEGAVQVANSGELPITVSITWRGAGGRVTLPSTATFDLPPAAEERTLYLDDYQSMAVMDSAGVLDRDIFPITGAMEESVPAGTARQFTVPDGARVWWSEQFLDPWR